LLYPDLPEDIQEVLRSLVFKEKPINTRDGRWFSVRIMPYRTFENRIDGVVITFTNISIAKKLEAVLREGEREMKALFKLMPNAFALFDSIYNEDGNFVDGKFVFINDAFERIMGVNNDEVQGKTLRQAWPAAEVNWAKTFEQVVVSGISASFEIKHAQNGKHYQGNVYRPGESQERFCVIFDEPYNNK